ncbi:microtubule-destabilizing protein 60 [Cannabis sativa]|uniref:microtubule-destabilizing protein 60 n=1 Tax=Cannabis sativa TaxID=3483 RepID=UPI0029CA4F59|nr:microtubule-destabilizing protein 60 [Cannabis sativa]
MEKSRSKSALKFVKSASDSAASWTSSSSTSSGRGMTKDEALKDRLCDKPKTAKENNKQQDFKLHTQQRAVKRAMFNYEVATKQYIIEQQKKQKERILKLIEDEEVRFLRKDMVPRAQLMPFFDRPFLPERSNRPLTIPKEPSLSFQKMSNNKCSSSVFPSSEYSLIFNRAVRL